MIFLDLEDTVISLWADPVLVNKTVIDDMLNEERTKLALPTDAPLEVGLFRLRFKLRERCKNV